MLIFPGKSTILQAIWLLSTAPSRRHVADLVCHGAALGRRRRKAPWRRAVDLQRKLRGERMEALQKHGENYLFDDKSQSYLCYLKSPNVYLVI
jgi:hypothetical protein